MQRAEPEQPTKRPRCDGSPRTPQRTRAAANQSADPDSQSSDLRTWDPEDVCSFLVKCGFREKKVLDIFRGSGAGRRGMATEGPSGESPRGRHPKGEAHRVEVSGGSGWREPEPGEGGAPTGGEQTGCPRWAQVKCKTLESLSGRRTSERPGEVCIFWWKGLFGNLSLLTRAIPALLYPRPLAVACGLLGSPGLGDPSVLTAAPGTLGPMRDFGRF